MSKERREITVRLEGPQVAKGRLTPWKRQDDPFQHAKPLAELAALIGGLPDDRDPEDILRDLRQIRTLRSLERGE